MTTPTPHGAAELLPCPFCGGAAELASIDDADSDDFGGEFIQCIHHACAASSMLIFPTMADAKPLLIEKWNRRAAIQQAAGAVPEGAAQMQRDTIENMATAAHAIDFWDEKFDYVNSDPIAHSDMMQIARILRNPCEEITRLRGEIGVICGLMDRALDVMQTVNGDDDDEDRKILRLRAKMASAIDHFRGADLLPAPRPSAPTGQINPDSVAQGKEADHGNV